MPQPLSPPTSVELGLRGWRAKEWGAGEGMAWAATSQHPALGPEQDKEHGTEGTSSLFYDRFSLLEAFPKLTIKT